jgi:hypothetical protein
MGLLIWGLRKLAMTDWFRFLVCALFWLYLIGFDFLVLFSFLYPNDVVVFVCCFGLVWP